MSNESTTLAAYKERVKRRQNLSDVPQPYGKSVADFIRTNREAGLPDSHDLPELIAHLLHDLDVFHGKA